MRHLHRLLSIEKALLRLSLTSCSLNSLLCGTLLFLLLWLGISPRSIAHGLLLLNKTRLLSNNTPNMLLLPHKLSTRRSTRLMIPKRQGPKRKSLRMLKLCPRLERLLLRGREELPQHRREWRERCQGMYILTPQINGEFAVVGLHPLLMW
jgi:hypothetical protein